MRGRTRSRARHADTQDGVGAEFTLVLGTVHFSQQGVNFLQVRSDVELRFNESGSEDIFDGVDGRLDTFASVDVALAISEFDGFVVVFGRPGWYECLKLSCAAMDGLVE